jgi:hypothetical protein
VRDVRRPRPGILVDERSLHDAFFGQWSLTPDDVYSTEALPTTEAYNAYLLRVAYGHPFEEILGAILPNTFPGWASSSGAIVTYLFGMSEDAGPIIAAIFLFAIAISVTLSPVVYSFLERVQMVLVGITSMPVIASLVAGKIAFLRQKSFIEAAHALGLPAHTVILKHILWFNCRALLVIQATLGMAEAILIETSLSYLGSCTPKPR